MTSPGDGAGRGPDPRRSVNLTLVAVIVLPLTMLALFVTLGSLTLHNQALRTLVGNRDARAANLAAGVLSSEVQRRTATVNALASRASELGPPALGLSLSGPAMEDFPGGLATFTRGGGLLAETEDRSDWDGDAVVDVLARADPGPAFSPAFRDSRSGEMIMLVAGGSGRGPVVIGAFSPATIARDTLANVFASASPDLSRLFIVDRDRRLLFQAGRLGSEEDVGSHPGVWAAIRGESGMQYVDRGNADEHVVAYSAVRPPGWAVVIEESWGSAASPILQTTLAVPLVLLPALLLALLTLWFGARQIVQPLRALEARAGALASGNLEAIEGPVGGIGEIRHLHDALIRAAHHIREAQQSQRRYIGAITSGQEEERHRLARELHDDTLQALIALNQRLQLAQLDQADANHALPLGDLQALTEQTIQNVRRSMRALRPVYLEALGLVAALEMLARETRQATGLPVSFHRVGSDRRIEAEAELGFYRIAQEALSNTIRHARASAADLTLTFEPDQVMLAIVDDGCGFTLPPNEPDLTTAGHFGLVHIRERTELIGGRLELDSTPGSGTRITITLPVVMVPDDAA